MKQKLSATKRFSNPLRLPSSVLFIVALAFGAWLTRAEQSVSLAWDANVETNIVGYRLYYGTTSQNLTNTVEAGLELTVKVTGLKDGMTYYFAVTARNSHGLESDFSDQVSYTVPGISLQTVGPANADDPIRLGFDAVPGYAYEILASEDCETWVTIYYTTPTVSGRTEFVDLDSPYFPRRFYRLIRH